MKKKFLFLIGLAALLTGCTQQTLVNQPAADINATININMKQCKGEGDTFSPNEGFCCKSLKAYGNYQINLEGKCVNIIERSKHLVCINCGNNICGLGENKCNCPEDCK